MKLIRGLHNLTVPLSGCVAALGNFDGVHLGHQALLTLLQKKSKALGVPSVVIVFEPQPREFFAGQETVPRLMRISEKYLTLKKFGIDILLCLYFDKELAELSAHEFVSEIFLAKLQARTVIVGHDFRFGAKRQGDYALLQHMAQQHKFEVLQVDPVTAQNAVISSTRVREALDRGDMQEAKNLLGRSYSLYGKVTYGHQRGRDLGFPTANINLHRELVPISGVFVIRARCGTEWFNGVANVGLRPTFHGQRVLLEVHLFDFNRMIYGANLEVEFLERLRPEKRYADFSLLVEQIKRDVAAAKAYFRKVILN